MMIVLFWFGVVVAYLALVLFIAKAIGTGRDLDPVPGDDAWRKFWERNEP